MNKGDIRASEASRNKAFRDWLKTGCLQKDTANGKLFFLCKNRKDFR
jgi:hypothetical protein